MERLQTDRETEETMVLNEVGQAHASLSTILSLEKELREAPVGLLHDLADELIECYHSSVTRGDPESEEVMHKREMIG